MCYSAYNWDLNCTLVKGINATPYVSKASIEHCARYQARPAVVVRDFSQKGPQELERKHIYLFYLKSEHAYVAEP